MATGEVIRVNPTKADSFAVHLVIPKVKFSKSIARIG